MSHNININKYNVFYKSEENYNTIFCNKYNINKCAIDYDLLLIKDFWEKNQFFIDALYIIIDNILNKLYKKQINLNHLNHLILGDFLTTFLRNSLFDPKIINLSISRKEYIYTIKNKIYIYKEMFFISEHYLKIHQELLCGIIYHKIAKKTIIREFKKNFFCNIIYTLNAEIFNNNLYINDTSNYPYNVVVIDKEYFSVSSFRNIHNILRIKSNMIRRNIDINGVIQANKIPICINSTLVKINELEINKELLLLYKDLNCSNFDEYQKKFLKFSSYNYTLNKNDRKEYIIFLSIYNKIIPLLLLLNTNLHDKEIYLPCFCDNRGRQYYSSILSPTFYKSIRNFIKIYNISNKFHNLESSKFYQKIIKHIKYVEKYKLENNFYKYIMIVLLIELGKIFVKTKENSCIINIEEFILIGIEYYDNKMNIDIKDKIYYNNFIEYINKLLNNKLDYDILLIKDATASGLQNFGILCGYKNNKIPYLNLNGDHWCDTYKYIINQIIKDVEYNNRNYWKKTLMTLNYNASWYKCFIYFLDALEKNNIFYKNFDIEKKKYLINMHKTFYESAKLYIRTDLYEHSIDKNKLLNFSYKKKILIKKTEYKINYKNIRDKYENFLYITENDENSTETALEANNMHYLDSLLVKNILLKYEVITVHDCFFIKLCELHNIMDLINKYYSIHIGEDKYSIFIIK